jgi:exopolyphosphatase/pppGpp-phosphohydrolase
MRFLWRVRDKRRVGVFTILVHSMINLTTGVGCCGARTLAPILMGVKVQPPSNEIMNSSCSIGKVRNTFDDLARLAFARLKELKGTDLERMLIYGTSRPAIDSCWR